MQRNVAASWSQSRLDGVRQRIDTFSHRASCLFVELDLLCWHQNPFITIGRLSVVVLACCLDRKRNFGIPRGREESFPGWSASRDPVFLAPSWDGPESQGGVATIRGPMRQVLPGGRFSNAHESLA